MSVSNTVVHQIYQGTGAQVNFAIPCAFVPQLASSLIKVYTIDADGVMTLQDEGALQDYTLTPAYDPVSNPNGPANVVFNVAPAADVKVLVYREVPLTQITNFLATDYYRPLPHENALDRLTFITQELADKLARVPTGQYLNAANFDWNIPYFDPAGEGFLVLTLNEDNTAFIWQTPAEIVAQALQAGGAGLPPGGDEFDYLEKNSASPGDGRWTPGVFSGFSARFNTVLNLSGVRAALLWLFDFTYLGPLVSLAGSGSSTVREKGTVVSSITLTATLTKRTDPLVNVRFYQGATLLDTQTGSPIPNSGVATFNYNTPFSDNISFTAQTVDDGTSGGPTNATSNTVSYTFVYPYYSGVGAPALNAAGVAALTKDVRVSTSDLTKSFSFTAGQTAYFAYPASYGDLTQIFDENNFDVTSGWTKSTKVITGLNGTPQNYTCYEKTVPFGVTGTTTFRFVR